MNSSKLTHRAVTLARLGEETRRRDALEALDGARRRWRITGQEIADACRPPLKNKSLVSHVFAARAKSQNVIDTTKRLIAERRRAARQRKAS